MFGALAVVSFLIPADQVRDAVKSEIRAVTGLDPALRGETQVSLFPTGFVSLSDAFTTGSSIMPQKRNPDAAELARAKVGRILGAFTALTVVMKGLPMTYSKDMQEDKEPFFDAIDNLALAIAAMTGVVGDLRPDVERLKEAASAGHATATDLADWLVSRL